jgi:hypothetical protein
MSTTFYNPAFVTLEGGVPQAEAALIAGIEADRVILTSTLRIFPVVRSQASCLPSVSPAPSPVLAFPA